MKTQEKKPAKKIPAKKPAILVKNPRPATKPATREKNPRPATISLSHIGQTSKKIEKRLTEHKTPSTDMIYYHFLPHTHNNGRKFNWTETQLLDQAKTKHARQFNEAWYSVDTNTINRHIDIPLVFLQLKHSSDLNNSHRRPPADNDPATMTTTHPATTNQIPQSTKEPIS